MGGVVCGVCHVRFRKDRDRLVALDHKMSYRATVHDSRVHLRWLIGGSARVPWRYGDIGWFF